MISGVASFCMAIIVPALPMIEIILQTDAAGSQFLVSGYLLGLAFSQPLWGPIADLFGRRRTALVGFGFFVASSIACAVVERLELLVIMRIFQGAGASVGAIGGPAFAALLAGERGTDPLLLIAAVMVVLTLPLIAWLKGARLVFNLPSASHW